MPATILDRCLSPWGLLATWLAVALVCICANSDVNPHAIPIEKIPPKILGATLTGLVLRTPVDAPAMIQRGRKRSMSAATAAVVVAST